MEFKITIPNGFTEFYSLRSPQQHPKLVEGLLMWSFFGAKKDDTRMPKCLLLVIIFCGYETKLLNHFLRFDDFVVEVIPGDTPQL